jgi:hypothetical protein
VKEGKQGASFQRFPALQLFSFRRDRIRVIAAGNPQRESKQRMSVNPKEQEELEAPEAEEELEDVEAEELEGDEGEDADEGEDTEAVAADDDEDGSTSLDELLAQRAAARRGGDEDDDDALMALASEADEPVSEAITTRVIPMKDRQEFVCNRCHLVKAKSQLADSQRGLCRDCV